MRHDAYHFTQAGDQPTELDQSAHTLQYTHMCETDLLGVNAMNKWMINVQIETLPWYTLVSCILATWKSDQNQKERVQAGNNLLVKRFHNSEKGHNDIHSTIPLIP